MTKDFGGSSSPAGSGSSTGTGGFPTGQNGDFGGYMPATIPFDFSLPTDGPWVAPDGVSGGSGGNGAPADSDF